MTTATNPARWRDWSITAIFLVVIALPLASNLTGHDGGDPRAEKRDLATMKDGFDKWFEDHFGFRSALIRWYGQTRLDLLHVSPTAKVIRGRNGWFFYADDEAIEDYSRMTPLSPSALDNWRHQLIRTHEWLAARHIAFVFMVIPDKHVIYAEEMPATVRHVSDVSHTDQLLDALKGTGVAVIDVREALVDAKARERIYQQADSHWNDRGAFVAYRAIIDAVRAQVPAVPPAWTRDDFDPVVRGVEGLDLAEIMGLGGVLREQDFALVPRRTRLARVVEPPGTDPTAEVGYVVTEIPGSTLPRAVVFRDSFMSRLVPFLSEHFSRVAYLWQNDFDTDEVDREHPAVVIQEIVGRHLYSFIPSPELIH